jgi:hypothetical protein
VVRRPLRQHGRRRQQQAAASDTRLQKELAQWEGKTTMKIDEHYFIFYLSYKTT